MPTIGKGMFQISKNFKLLLFEYQQMIVSNCLLKSERWLQNKVKNKIKKSTKFGQGEKSLISNFTNFWKGNWALDYIFTLI